MSSANGAEGRGSVKMDQWSMVDGSGDCYRREKDAWRPVTTVTRARLYGNGSGNTSADCTKNTESRHSEGHRRSAWKDSAAAGSASVLGLSRSSTASSGREVALTSSRRSAGTNLCDSTGFYDVTGPSTAFDQPEKQNESTISTTGPAGVLLRGVDAARCVTRRRLDFDDESSSAFIHSPSHHHRQQQQQQGAVDEQPDDVNNRTTFYRPWERTQDFLCTPLLETSTNYASAARSWPKVSSSSVVVRPWELSPITSTHHRSSPRSNLDPTLGTTRARTSTDHADSGYCSSQTPDTESMHYAQERMAERRSASFEPTTVRLLETWYSANIRHPYPDDVTLAALATGGGISVKQVRKWLANRRVRTCNTLTYNGAVHPKRLRRLHRQTTSASAETELRQPAQSTPVAGPAGIAQPPAGIPSRVGYVPAGTFQTSTPLLPQPAGVYRQRRHSSWFDVDSTGHVATSRVRHQPYVIPRRVAAATPYRRSDCGAETWVAPRVTSHTDFVSVAAANFGPVHQMAARQLNVFNVFHSA